MRKYKQHISIILIMLIIFPLFPKESSATKFTHNPNNPTVIDLINQGYAEFNENILPINPHVYETYKIVVWGDWSDTNNHEKRNGEHRYLGQDKDGFDVTNDLFDNDDTSLVPLPDKNWQKINIDMNGWKNLNSNQINQILYSKGVKNDGKPIESNYSISEILKNRSNMKQYIIIQSEPTESTAGSVRLQHKTSNGKTWYDTFTIPKLPSDEIIIKYMNVATGNDIKSPLKEDMKSGSNEYEIPDFTSNNYKFEYIKMDNGDEFYTKDGYKEGTTFNVESESTGKKHEVKIYYKPIGDIIAALEVTADPSYIRKGMVDNIEVTLDARGSVSNYGIDEYYFEASLNSDYSDSKVVQGMRNKIKVTFKNLTPNTTIYGRVTVKDYDTGDTATAVDEVMVGKTAGIDQDRVEEYLVCDFYMKEKKYIDEDDRSFRFEEKDFEYKDRSYDEKAKFKNKDPDFFWVEKWQYKIKLKYGNINHEKRFHFKREDHKTGETLIASKADLNEKVNKEIKSFLNERIDVVLDLVKKYRSVTLRVYQKVYKLKSDGSHGMDSFEEMREFAMVPKYIDLYHNITDIKTEEVDDVIKWIYREESLDKVEILDTIVKRINREIYEDKRSYLIDLPQLQSQGLDYIRTQRSGYKSNLSNRDENGISVKAVIRRRNISINDMIVYSLYTGASSKIKIECRDVAKELDGKNSLIYDEEMIVTKGNHTIEAPEYQTDPIKYSDLKGYVLDSSRISSPQFVTIKKRGEEELITFWYITGRGDASKKDLRAIITTYPNKEYVSNPIEIVNNSFGEYTGYQWYVNLGKVTWPEGGTSLTKTVPTVLEVRLEIWDDEGNTSSDTKTIEWFDTDLDAIIGADPTSCIEGDTVNITNNSTGEYDNWEWKIDGDVKAWGKAGGTIIAEAGTTTASLKVWNSKNGKSDTDTTTIGAVKPNVPPVAIIKSPDYEIRGNTINVKDYSSDSDGTIVNRQWSITGASKYTSNLKTDGSGGTINVDEFTTITVHLTVTDDRGASDSTSQQIIIGGDEEIDIQIVEGGTKKENRKISLDLSNSSVGAYYSIDWPKTKYTFIPIAGLSKNDIKYEKTEKGIDLLSKEEGLFDLRVDMQDTGGRVKSKILKINITPDIPPVVNNSVDKTITFRTEEDIEFDSEMYSADDDTLQLSWNKIFYDSDNDGDYDEETPIDVSKGGLSLDEVGMYKIVGFAKEAFGEPTIEKFVTDADRLESRVEIIVKVDNLSPKAGIETDIPPHMENVDVMLIIDEKVDTGDEYKVHDLDAGTIEPTPIRDYIKGGIAEIVNKFKGKLVEANIYIKDLKTDKYIKTETATRTGDFANNNDNNFSSTYSYSKNNFNGVLDRTGVAWSERRVNVTESFSKSVYKNSPTRNQSIFNDQYYVNESKNISSNPGRKFITSAVFTGNIPRHNISWSSNYNYHTKYATESEYKSNLPSKSESYFNPQKGYSSGGYIGTLYRQGVSWTTNLSQFTKYQTRTRSKFDLDSPDTSVFPQYRLAPIIDSLNGQYGYAVSSIQLPITGVNWTTTTVPGGKKTIYDEIALTYQFAMGPPDFPYSITKVMAGETVTLYKDGPPYKTGSKGGGPHSDDKWEVWRQHYKGRYTKPPITKYSGTAHYGGNISYQYPSSYNGTATYGGNVTKTTFRDYTGRADYYGNITEYSLLDGFRGVCSYLGRVIKLEKESIEPNWSVNTNKYVVYVGDNGINNQSTLNDYESRADADVISISNKNLSSAELSVNYTDISENVDEVIDYIAGENPPIAKSAVLINEEAFNILTKESDPENDDIDLREIKYFHDPDYYLNSLGITSLPQNWQDAKGFDMNNLILDKPGKYVISYRLEDEPKKDSRFDEYKKYSNEAQVSIFGHRRPIVTDFDINFLYNPGTGKYEEPDFLVEAYDPDYYKLSTGEGRTDKGVLAYRFRWKTKAEPDSEYRFEPPTALDAGIYNIEVMARDIDYAWSLPYVIEIDLTNKVLELDAELYPEKDKFEVEIIGVPASEDLKVINIETIHPHPVNSVEFALYEGTNEVVPKVTLNNPTDISGTHKSKITWEDIRNYTILSSLPDGMYKGKIEAKAGAVRESIEWDVKVHTPINLVPYVNGGQNGEDIVVVSDDTFTVKAEVSEYTKEVTVQLPFDCMNLSETITYNAGDTIKLNGGLGDTVYSKSFYLPPTSVPIEIQNQQAIFKAYAVNHSLANPNMEIAVVDFKTIGVKLENLRISKIADYNWKNYFVDSNGNPTTLAIDGIKVKDMPVYANDYDQSIKLGYKVYFKIDSVGLSEDDDEIEIEASYYALDEDNTLYKADIYVEDDNSGEYKRLEKSLYRDIAKYLTLNKGYKSNHEKFPSKITYNTWKFDIFLPYSAKIVKEGESLDLINDNTKKYRLLVVFDIVGKKSSGAEYDYSLKEMLWSTDNGRVYGRNRPTNLNLLGKGQNHGEVFYFDLKNTLQDDFKLYREW